MTEKTEKITADETDSGIRLDKFIASNQKNMSRNRVQSLITSGNVRCNGHVVLDRSYHVKESDEVEITTPPAADTKMRATEIPLNIVYEDDDLIVIDKQAGLTTHPGAGNHSDTLANALLAHCGDTLSGVGGEKRPGIVHRLDKDTSGLMVVAKNDKAHNDLATQIKERSLKRVYNAVVWGVPTPPVGKITANIGRSSRDRKKMTALKSGGREATTHYKVLEVFGKNFASLVECRLETGRTHQIRVHFNHKGHSLIGDQTYGGKGSRQSGSMPKQLIDIIDNFNRQALHSIYISFTHPRSKKQLEFTSNLFKPATEDISKLVESLGGISV